VSAHAPFDYSAIAFSSDVSKVLELYQIGHGRTAARHPSLLVCFSVYLDWLSLGLIACAGSAARVCIVLSLK
jgi:hypothetical protein